MGNRTELIFGASLKKETPNHVIDTLKYLMYEVDEKPSEFPFTKGNYRMVLRSSSYSFGVNETVGEMWLSSTWKQWHISTRSNMKNYQKEIETFLEWIKPYIAMGSGDRQMYAIVIEESAETPTIFYLEEE